MICKMEGSIHSRCFSLGVVHKDVCKDGKRSFKSGQLLISGSRYSARGEFNVSQYLTFISLLGGGKVYGQTGWEPWPDFLLDLPLQLHNRWTLQTCGAVHTYVTLFLANCDPLPLSHFVTHPWTPKSPSHIFNP